METEEMTKVSFQVTGAKIDFLIHSVWTTEKSWEKIKFGPYCTQEKLQMNGRSKCKK